MHGLGNDFIIINNINQSLEIETLDIPTLANRYIGIGFDQLLVIEPSEKADFFCRIYNADGSEAEQCGNGLRCVARFVVENKLHANPHLVVPREGAGS
ncbi:MAG: diaminopimelate epimerase, partial [Gammaproteobacteria bacterium]